MIKVEIEPRGIPKINHDEIHVMHRELSEVNRAIAEPQEITPLFDAGLGILSVSVSLFDVGGDDAYLGQLPVDMRRWKDLECIEKDIVIGNLNARNALWVEQISDGNVHATKKTFERNF